MRMKIGEQWHCTNPACHCELLVQTDSETGASNPRCVCGAPMKKNYVPPHVTYLDFLRTEEPVSAPAASRKG